MEIGRGRGRCGKAWRPFGLRAPILYSPHLFAFLPLRIFLAISSKFRHILCLFSPARISGSNTNTQLLPTTTTTTEQHPQPQTQYHNALHVHLPAGPGRDPIGRPPNVRCLVHNSGRRRRPPAAPPAPRGRF